MKPVLLFTACLGLASCKRHVAEAPPQMPPAAVGVRTIQAEPIIEWEEFSARVEAMERVDLSARVSGYLDEVLFSAGQTVTQGQELFRIDPLPYRAKQAQTEALLARADAAMSSAKTEFDRVAGLLAARAMTVEEADARQAAYLQAVAAQAAASAENDLAKLDLERTTVRSPIAGKISRALVTAGNQVSGQPGAATTLTSIVSVDPIYAYADLDENTLLRVQDLLNNKKVKLDEKGRIPVNLQLGDEEGFSHLGWFESLDNQVIASTGTIVLRAIFPNEKGKMVPGMFARIRLPLSEEKPTILVEETALKTDQGEKYVFVIDEHSLAQYRPVKLGAAVGNRRIITTGLKAGDVVVVNGLAKIFMPGMPVKPEPVQP